MKYRHFFDNLVKDYNKGLLHIHSLLIATNMPK